MKMPRNVVSLAQLIAQNVCTVRGKFAHDFLLTAASNFSIALFGAVGGILAARLLGPEGRGELAAAVVWAGILGGIAQLGLPQALTYVTSRESQAVGSIFFTTIILLLVQSVVILAIGWVVITGLLAQLQPSAINAVRVYLFSIPFSLLITYLSTISQGLKRFELFNAPRVASAVGYVVSLILASVLNLAGAKEVASLLLGAQAIVALATLGWFLEQIRPTGYFEWRHAHQLLSYGLSSHLGNLSWMANARLDQFLMSALIGLDELGYYAVAVSYAMVLFPLSGAFAMVTFPQVAGSEEHTARRTIWRALTWTLVVSGAGALVLALVCPAIMPLLFGPNYQSSIYPAVVLLGGTVFLGGNYVLSDGLRGLGAPLLVSVAEMFGVVITVSGLFILLPQFGIRGAAWVSLLSYAVVFLILLVQFKRRKARAHLSRSEVAKLELRSER